MKKNAIYIVTFKFGACDFDQHFINRFLSKRKKANEKKIGCTITLFPLWIFFFFHFFLAYLWSRLRNHEERKIQSMYDGAREGKNGKRKNSNKIIMYNNWDKNRNCSLGNNHWNMTLWPCIHHLLLLHFWKTKEARERDEMECKEKTVTRIKLLISMYFFGKYKVVTCWNPLFQNCQ